MNNENIKHLIDLMPKNFDFDCCYSNDSVNVNFKNNLDNFIIINNTEELFDNDVLFFLFPVTHNVQCIYGIIEEHKHTYRPVINLVDTAKSSVYKLYVKRNQLCTNIKNCFGCINCHDCIGCVNCNNCNKCKDCDSCFACTMCIDCYESSFCSKCIDCNSMVYHVKSTNKSKSNTMFERIFKTIKYIVVFNWLYYLLSLYGLYKLY